MWNITAEFRTFGFNFFSFPGAVMRMGLGFNLAFIFKLLKLVCSVKKCYLYSVVKSPLTNSVLLV